MRDCQQALERNPYHFPAAIGMGHCHLELFDAVAALEGFRLALSINPDMENVRAQVGYLQRTLERCNSLRANRVSKENSMRKLSCVAPDWWDYTTIDLAIVNDAARLTPQDLEQLSRPGFRVVMYDTIEEFYLAEALEYIEAWKQSTPDNPAGICGPIGPTEQLPLVARLVNAMDLPLGKLDAHFWGMDEWVLDGKAVGMDHPLSFAKADLETVLPADPQRTEDAGGQSPLSHR